MRHKYTIAEISIILVARILFLFVTKLVYLIQFQKVTFFHFSMGCATLLAADQLLLSQWLNENLGNSDMWPRFYVFGPGGAHCSVNGV